MEKILDIQTTVYEQLKQNRMPLVEMCALTNIPTQTIKRWRTNEPLSISHLKKLNNLIELVDRLDKLKIGIELKDNCISLSTGGRQEFTDEPINVQIKNICKAEIDKSEDYDYIGLMVKVIKVCR